MVVKTKQIWLISVVTQKSMVVKTKQDFVDFGGYSKKVWWLKQNRFRWFQWLLKKRMVVKTKQISLISMVTQKTYHVVKAKPISLISVVTQKTYGG